MKTIAKQKFLMFLKVALSSQEEGMGYLAEEEDLFISVQHCLPLYPEPNPNPRPKAWVELELHLGLGACPDFLSTECACGFQESRLRKTLGK